MDWMNMIAGLIGWMIIWVSLILLALMSWLYLSVAVAFWFLQVRLEWRHPGALKEDCTEGLFWRGRLLLRTLTKFRGVIELIGCTSSWRHQDGIYTMGIDGHGWLPKIWIEEPPCNE